MRGLGSARVVQVACGASHTLALTRAGDVFSCGSGLRGALGHGYMDNATEMTHVKALAGVPVAQVAAGDNYSAAVTASGFSYTWYELMSAKALDCFTVVTFQGPGSLRPIGATCFQGPSRCLHASTRHRPARANSDGQLRRGAYLLALSLWPPVRVWQERARPTGPGAT
jgi:hypothetical protein